VQPVPGAPDWLQVVTAEEQPELWERARQRHVFDKLWPEYNNHGNQAPRYFGAIYPRFAHLQALLVDRRTSGLAGRARTIPFAWDGTLGDLPAGIDAMGLRAVDGARAASTLSALTAEVLPAYQGAGLSKVIIQVMAAMARSSGFEALVAPVRPNRKHLYPLTPIERYVAWKRADGLPFDPWLRAHVRLGGTTLRCEPRSMEIAAPVGDWEAWTSTPFPEDGDYVFPDGLAPLKVRDGTGLYWEPNVWVLHGT
jgi:GNAT superfamily N-acetyltransferase